MKHKNSWIFSVLIFLLFNSILSNGQEKWSTNYAYYGSGGRLAYTPDEEGNIIPDFSHVGYSYGDNELPTIPNSVEVSPVDGDDAVTIQAAIESLYSITPNNDGFRGAVLLKKGTYEIEGHITITESGIVLRGEGQDDNGTILIATGTSDRSLVQVGSSGSLSVNNSSKVSISEDYVPVGRNYVIVSSASNFNTGDDIVLYRPGTQNWIQDLKMDKITSSASDPATQWTASSYNFYFERRITKLNGDTIFFRNPVVMALDKNYGGGFVYRSSFNRINNIGIENICLKSEYTSEEDEAHSWTAIKFSNVEHSWVKDVSSYYFAYACVSLGRSSKLNSVIDCTCNEAKSIITGARRYSFYCEGQLNLFKACSTTEGRHDYVTGSRVCGPNVFTQCKARNTYADIGPHHRWAMGTLYDIIDTDGEINVQDRDNMGSGHGWAGANQVFWNCKGSSSVCQSPWASAKNYNIGFQGAKSNGARSGRPDGVWEGQNKAGLFPESLYEAQLDDRMKNTTIFSVYSELVGINDSTFQMNFNMPLNELLIIPENFIVSGTAGLEDNNYTVAIDNASSVLITFYNIGIITSNSTLIITAENILSINNDTLLGTISSTYIEPDKRPVVTGSGITTNNEAGSFVAAKSTKPGFVYLIRMGQANKSIEDFEAAIAKYMGIKAEVTTVNKSVALYTEGIYGGVYNYYAVDEDGRISAAAFEVAVIEQTRAITSIELFDFSEFEVRLNGNSIIVNPNSADLFDLYVFDYSGRKIIKKNKLKGIQTVDIPLFRNAPLIIKIISKDLIETRKIAIHF